MLRGDTSARRFPGGTTFGDRYVTVVRFDKHPCHLTNGNGAMARSHVTKGQGPAAAAAYANAVPLNPIPADAYEIDDFPGSGDAVLAATGGAVAHAPARGRDEARPGARGGLVDGGLLPDPAKPAHEILMEAAPGLPEPTPFEFYFDGASHKEITGWIMRNDKPSRRCLVALQEGDRVLARTVASRFRPDLALAGIGDGCCAFAIPMPAILLDGCEHLLEIIEESTGFRLTADPIRWRSDRNSGQAGLSHMSERIDGARLVDLRQRPDAEVAIKAVGARMDDRVAPPSGAESANCTGTWPVQRPSCAPLPSSAHGSSSISRTWSTTSAITPISPAFSVSSRELSCRF